MHLFHKWKDYPKFLKRHYRGEEISVECWDYRMCTVCGKVQEYTTGWGTVYGLARNYWQTLDEPRKAVFMKQRVNNKDGENHYDYGQ